MFTKFKLTIDISLLVLCTSWYCWWVEACNFLLK